jgi:hypothetical protein
MRKLPLTIRSGASAPTECTNTRPELTPTIGSAMASAEREPTRAPARVESQSVRDQHLGAGGRILSPAFWRFHRAKVAQDLAGWLAGLNAGLVGGCPIGVRDCSGPAGAGAVLASRRSSPDLSCGVRGHGDDCATAAKPIDLEATTKDVRLRIDRVLAGILSKSVLRRWQRTWPRTDWSGRGRAISRAMRPERWLPMPHGYWGAR